MDRRIALVSLPFASSRRPSLQIGLLAGLAREAGWQADPLHLNLDFARMLGRARYEALCQHRGTMLSEWVFAGAAFSGQDHTIEGTLTGFDIDPSTSALGMPADDALAWLHRVRSVLAPAFLRAVSEGIDWSAYDVVGFTSTFQQNVASLALARAIKEEHPRVTTLFGGANFDSVMGLEYLRVFPYVDYAAIGEADTSLPSFLRDFTGPDTVVHTPGMAHRDPETGEVLLEPLDTPFDDLDALPTPDYDDYFDRATRLGFFDHDSPARIDLPYESARGCWWGQKHHCIFCGLNSQTMRFRSKSPDKVVAEVTALSHRHHSLGLEAVDNILDRSYLKTVLPMLAEQEHDFDIFYEIKANNDPDDLAALAEAGVRRVQPGIESLSTDLLAVMRKGTTAIRNVCFLKWARHFDIRPSWNFLWGFPGETWEHYLGQLDVMASISHLHPPDGEGRLWLERFSPMFTDSASFGITDIRPLSSYAAVYPAALDLTSSAYFFEYEMEGALPDERFDAVRTTLNAWRDAWAEPTRPSLTCRGGPGFVEITEGRPGFEAGTYLLDGVIAQVYKACERRPISLTKVAERVGAPFDEVCDIAAALRDRRLMMIEDPYALSLAVPA